MAMVGVVTYTMLDAEFISINGVAAPTITKTSPLFDLGATAAAAAGTTTVTLPVGKRQSNSMKRLIDVMRRAATSYRITVTE